MTACGTGGPWRPSAAVLPHHQWDIAEKLARLSELRRRQREILSAVPGGADRADADIARILSAQRRAQDLALADIEYHVRLLESLAGRGKVYRI